MRSSPSFRACLILLASLLGACSPGETPRQPEPAGEPDADGSATPDGGMTGGRRPDASAGSPADSSDAKPTTADGAGDDSGDAGPLPAPRAGAPDAGGVRLPGMPGGLPRAAEAFDDRIVHSYELTIAPADIAKMPMLARNPATEGTYVPATVKIDGEEVGTVGVRIKGAYALQICIDKSFQIVCPKMSLKVKFDEIDTNKRYKGLKKVNLHSMMADPTKMHEHLGYDLFRAAGIVAPRAAHAKVTVNGELKGIFAVTEVLDGRFTADRFGSAGDGNLYKEVWPTSTDPAYYHRGLATNKDQKQTHEGFVAFATDLSRAAPGDLPKVIDRFTDLDYMLRYTAVDRILSNWDGFSTFYCGGATGGCGNHNYYWYEDQMAKRFWLVVWDLDQTWGVHSPHEIVLPPWTQRLDGCPPRAQLHGNFLLAPGCDPIFRGLQAAGPAAHKKAFRRLLDGPFDVKALHAEVDRRAAVIADAVKSDPAITFVSWQENVGKLKSDITLLREKLEAQAEGKMLTSFGLRTDAPNDFEAISAVEFAMGASTEPNAATFANRSLNRTGALNGAADARVDFTFRTDKAPWTYLNYRIPFLKGTVSLAGTKRVRVRIKSDRPRNVRIELDGPKAKSAAAGIRFGWGIGATPEGTSVVLELDKMALPAWAKNAPDVAAEVRSAVTALYISVDPTGLNAMGFFPPGGSDKGFVQIDDLEFLAD